MSSTRKTPEHAAYGLPLTEGAGTEAVADEAAADGAVEAAEVVPTEAAEAVEEVAEAAADAVGVAVFGLDPSESVNSARDASLNPCNKFNAGGVSTRQAALPPMSIALPQQCSRAYAPVPGRKHRICVCPAD
jgi:hypothetical protein